MVAEVRGTCEWCQRPYLSTLQVLVVGLGRVTHSLHALVVYVEAEGDALVVYRLRLTGAVHVYSIFTLHVPGLVIDHGLVGGGGALVKIGYNDLPTKSYKSW